MVRALVVIPSRLGSSRFFGKPLVGICGKEMILHCWDSAVSSGVGDVLVACGDSEIYDCVVSYGGSAVMTDSGLLSGSDRVYAALELYDGSGEYDIVINMQGDLPSLPSDYLGLCLYLLESEGSCDISTLGVSVSDVGCVESSDIVKIMASPVFDGRVERGRAYGFSRSLVPHGAGVYYHHIGVYGYRRDALRRFVSSPPSVLEERESLEQWRALELGMRIDVGLVGEVPVSVDVEGDIERAELYMSGRL